MGNSDGRISVERESVETMLAVLTRLRGIFNPYFSVLREYAPGRAAFAERLEAASAKLEAALQ